jgi:hypothetical protein
MTKTSGYSLYAFFWVISPASEFYMPTFRNTVLSSYLSAYEDGTDRVFRNVGIYIIQTLGNYPEESIQHSEHGESLKSRIQAFRP